MRNAPGSPARFLLERWIQKGVLTQLALMAALIVGVATLGGFAAWLTTSGFENVGRAIWWAFLRLTDPGYLGDDEGVALRVISTTVTVLGYVLFMGTMIAVMTQWLFATMRRLESGLTPISMHDHVVVLGWTNRTPEIVLQLMTAQGRLRRFLERTDVGKLRIVIQAERVDAERRALLRDHLGEHWSESQVLMRSGSSVHAEHLARLDLNRAAVILVPGADFELGGADASDTRVIKTLLTIDQLQRDLAASDRPFVVAELFDPLKAPLADESFAGPLEVLSSNQVVSRLLSQGLRHRGLSRGLFGLLSHRRGNSLYVREFPELVGLAPRSLFASFPGAVVIGTVRADAEGHTADIDPASDAPLAKGDLLVLLAQKYDDGSPTTMRPPAAASRAQKSPPRAPSDHRVHRILVLGWSHKLRALAHELAASRSGRFEMTVMSRFPAADRERWLQQTTGASDRVRFQHVEGDYAIGGELDQFDLSAFDHVALLASDWASSSEEADARTVLGFVLIRSLVRDLPRAPEVLVEFLDADSGGLFQEQLGTFLITPQVLSYLLAHIAMRPELSAVYDALFCTGGTEIELRSANLLGVVDRPVTFLELQNIAFDRGMVALGLVPADGPPLLNPDRTQSFTLTGADQVVVLTAG